MSFGKHAHAKPWAWHPSDILIAGSTADCFWVARPEASKGVGLPKTTPFEDSGRATQTDTPPDCE
jgi:hypothetical protein